MDPKQCARSAARWVTGGIALAAASYATYAAVIAVCLLAVEFSVLNVFPGNPIGHLLLTVPTFYFTVAMTFLLNDLAVAAWRLFKRKRRVRRT